MGKCGAWAGVLLAALVLGASAAAAAATPAASRASRMDSLKTQIQDFSDKLAAAHARNMALQSEVTDLEKQNQGRQQQLQQRDEQIAALQKQLEAAGVPASAASAGK